MQKMSDTALIKCPKCKANKLEKIFSQTAFQFKGSGWYVTDYSNKGKSEEKKTDTAEKADKTDTTEKAEKTEKADKSEKVEKVEKTEKADKSGKKETAAPATSA